MFGFALTVFIGAFLLFQVQPLIGKYILPWFGGSTGVWTTCVLFFQVALLVGYAYTHALVRWFKPRQQVATHLVLVILALVSLPITPAEHWKPTGAENPTGRIFLLLLASLGLPYIVLSATGPLMQAWFHLRFPERSPYRLYALSNLGSLLALFSYPFLFEPRFSRGAQAGLWSWGLVLFAVACWGCALQMWRAGTSAMQATTGAESVDPKPMALRGDRLLWFILPACASVLLLAFTNKLCQDVAVIPFLWVLPLGLYLLTFVICFDSPGFYSRRVIGAAFVISAIVLGRTLIKGAHYPLIVQVLVYCGALFIACMLCHGELYRLKPASRHLTAYYLLIAAGGAAGGLFVGVIAPRLFNSYAELGGGFWICGLLLTLLYARDKTSLRLGGRAWPVWQILIPGLILLAGIFLHENRIKIRNTIDTARTFYGVLRVFEWFQDEPSRHGFTMSLGETLHGHQFANPIRAEVPTTYFHEFSGVGLVLRDLERREHRKVGIIGLGAGTLAAYGKPGDTFRFYEINAEVERLARKHFTYLTNSRAQIEVILGDGRLSLEREPTQAYDALVLDAFSSDAIPVHLLTQEAFGLYLRHLRPDGVMAVHISNQHLDLRPVVLRLASHFKLNAAVVSVGAEMRLGYLMSDWILLAREEKFLAQETFSRWRVKPDSSWEHLPLWTDEYSSLFPILKKF